MISLLLAAASMLAGPAIPAEAQVNNESDGPGPIEVEALVSGRTNPPEDPHNLGINRVSGPSEFVGLTIGGVVTCTDTTPLPSVNVVTLVSPQPVAFSADDDITDGFGEVTPTASGSEFEGTFAGNIVRAAIDAGRFHRLFGLVEVDLDLAIRVTDANGNEICHALVPFRVIFQLLPDPDGAGFVLVGVGRRHHRIHLRVTDDQNNEVFHVRVWTRASIARTVCGIVSPHSTRVTEPPILTTTSTPISPGRGDFHPCPPEGEGTPISDIVQVDP